MPGAMVGVVCRLEVGSPGLGADSDMLVESLDRVALHPRHSHTMRTRSQHAQIANRRPKLLQAVGACMHAYSAMLRRVCPAISTLAWRSPTV